MADPPPSSSTSHLLSTHRSLVDTLTSFLTVCTHHILFLRKIYPPLSFLATRAYNYPVRQNRHPAVCTWINDAIAAIRDQLTKNTISTISLCIYELDTNRVLERWTFNLQSFPSVPKRDRDVPFSTTEDIDLPAKVNLVDLEATVRATLSRLSSASTRLKPLPSPPTGPECSFTLTIELASNADRPVSRLSPEERKWIVAEPDLLPHSTSPSKSISATTSTNPTNSSKSTAEGSTTPIRRLTTGPLHLELFVTESAHKFSYNTPSQRPPAVRAAEMSYGAGTEEFAKEGSATEKFDVVNGYEDVEGNDLNRKPGGGIGTDYQRG